MLTTFFSGLSIRFKLAIGSLFFVLILLSLGIFITLGQRDIQKSVITVVNESQPRMLQVIRLSEEVKASVASFSLFLLSEDKSQKEDYLKKVENVRKALKKLEISYENSGRDPDLLLIRKISATFSKIEQLNSMLMRIAGNVALRIPGQAHAVNNLGPMIQQALGLLNVMTTTDFDSEQVDLLQEIHGLNLSWSRLSGEIRAYLTFRSEALKKNVLEFYQQIVKKQKQLIDSGELELDQEDAFEQLSAIADRFGPALTALFELHGSANWRRDVSLIRHKVLPRLNSLESLIGELVIQEQSLIERTSNHLMDDLENSVTFSIFLVAGGVIIGSLVMFLVVSLVTKRINISVNAMEDIAYGSGNLNQKLNADGHDEISRLAQAFNIFVEKIKGVVDLVIASATMLANESGRMNDATRQSQSLVSRQREDLEVIEKAVDDMTASSGLVSEKARAASDAAIVANDFSHKGQKTVDEVVAAIRNLTADVENTNQVVQDVQSQSEQIGVVLSVIRNISDQTNLLALNAAIEAARAGEYGRGFAVVADEVRTLSNKISNETDHIQKIIQSLQSGAKNAAASMEHGLSSANATAEMAGSANEALSSISDTVKTILEMNTGIAELTGQQADSTEDIRQKVHSINEIAVETKSTVDLATASSNEFQIMAGQLRGLVEQFLLGNPDEEVHSTPEEEGNRPAENARPVSGDTGNSGNADDGDIELF